ncbi:MAG: hypothetical protein ABIJ00_06650 [Candidatus Eisenbacteria bacterium]
MELSAFGAIMKFAMDREADVRTVITTMKSAEGFSLKELGEMIAADATKSIKLIEQTRREHVNELILEPVSGLDSSNYEFKELASGELTELQTGEYLTGILDVIIGFYMEAAARITNPEATRTFNRIAKAKMKLKASLEEYLSTPK